MKRYLIAICGGIGAGKSVVSKVLTALGYPVYDCDAESKKLMDQSTEIKQKLIKNISTDAVDDEGNINRKLIAEVVFADKKKLQALNKIVHSAVKDDLIQWVIDHNDRILFVETAILHESGLDAIADEAWEVVAPDDVRIERVVRRNGCTREHVRLRMASQNKCDASILPVREIKNFGNHSLLLQINALLAEKLAV